MRAVHEIEPEVRAARGRDPGRVLITGGAGFIGSALVLELARRGTEVVVLDRRVALELPAVACVGDALDVRAFQRVERDHGPFDSVIVLAAKVGVRRVLSAPEACRRDNVEASRALVAWIASLSPARRPRVFAASSSEVYREKFGPTRESDPLRGEHDGGRWAYAASKIAGERLLDASDSWTEERGPVHLRFFNVVGPGQDAAQGMVLPRFVEAAREGRALEVHGDGSQVRTLAHVDDVARTLAALIAHPHLPAGALNVGGRARASVREIATAVERAADRRLELRSIDPRRELGAAFEDIAWREPDLTLLENLGVPIPDRTLDEIVRDTWARHAPRRRACASPAS